MSAIVAVATIRVTGGEMFVGMVAGKHITVATVQYGGNG